VADLKGDVGEGADNKAHDVGLVQLMLRVVKDAKNQPYLATDFNFIYGAATKDAIVRFQQDSKLVPIPDAKKDAGAPPAPAVVTAAMEKAGLVGKNSLTFKKLNQLLPAKYADVVIMEDAKLIYVPAAEANAKGEAATIGSKAELDASFRSKLSNLVTQMYAAHKIALSIPKSGWRRDFAWQYMLKLKGTGAAPGESNHQYGQAADIGMNGLQWVSGDGNFQSVDYWLNPVSASGLKMPQSKRDALWDARNAIAYKSLGLYPTSKAGDDVHVQGYSDASVDYPRSLATLLNLGGKVRWKALPHHEYGTDYGLGGLYFNVGSATELWRNQGKVTAADLVTAIKAAGKDLAKLPVFKDFDYVKNAVKAQAAPAAVKLPPLPVAKVPGAALVDGKSIKMTDIKQTDIDAIRKVLKQDWASADTNWQKWKPIP
jgi:hypothetical protein